MSKLEIGTRVKWEGDIWRVIAYTGFEVELEGTRKKRILVAFMSLVESPGFEVLQPNETEAVVLGDVEPGWLDELTPDERSSVLKLEEHVLEVLTGYRSGTSTLALSDEPRDAFDTGIFSLTQRIDAKATELSVNNKSVWRYVDRYRKHGVSGLIDGRKSRMKKDFPRVDERVKRATLAVLDGLTNASRVSKTQVARLVRRELRVKYPGEDIDFPSSKTFNPMIDRLDAGRGTFGHTKGKRERANRPKSTYRTLEVVRPGEAIVIDATPLDAFAIDPVNLKWVQVRLTIALDLYSGSILAWRFTPVAEKAVDAALLLYDIIRPKRMRAGWPENARWAYVGVPENVVIELVTEEEREMGVSHVPFVEPETVWIDRGRVFVSTAFRDACRRLGINMQFARPYTPTDKAHVERLFDTIRGQFVMNLPSYKGSHVLDRGLGVEGDAVLLIEQIEELFAEWVATYWQRRPHEGLELAVIPKLDLSPNEMFQEGVLRAGFTYVVPSARLYYDLLPTVWRKINHYGVDVDGLRYNADVLREYRDVPSLYAEVHGGKWPFKRDPRDLSSIYFLDPELDEWVEVPRHKPRVEGRPFDENTLAYAKTLVMERLGVTRNARADAISRELDDLMDRHAAGFVAAKREHRLAALRVMRAQEVARDVARTGAAKAGSEPIAPDAELDFEAIFGADESMDLADSGTDAHHDDEFGSTVSGESLPVRKRSIIPVVDPDDFEF